jgi:PAS domain S-box-containing protein
MNILIVDDQPINLKLLRAQLEAEGHAVFDAANGIEALAMLDREAVGGVVSDILMPRMDGYRLCLEVRKIARFSHLPLVLYTSTYNSPTDRELARNAGADAYISKPAPTDVIMAALHAAATNPRTKVTAPTPQEIESPVLRQYSETLVRKLEDKSAELERACEGLAQIEARLSGLVESALDAIIAFDDEGRIVLFNAAAEAMFGCTRTAAIRGPMAGFFPASFQQAWQAELAHQSAPRLLRALRRDGSEFPIEASISWLDTSQGRLYTMFIRDITERDRIERALHESEERFRSIIEASQDWIWEVDREGRLVYTNSAVQQMLGYSPEELLGRNVMALIHPADRAMVVERIPSFLEHPRPWLRQPLRWCHRDGSVHVLESTANPVLDIAGRPTGYRGAHHDDTGRLAQEERIRRLARIHAVLSAIGNIVVRASNRNELLHDACRVAVDQGGFKAACIGEGAADGTLRVVTSYGDASALDLAAPSEPMIVRLPGSHHQHPGVRAFRENRRVVIRDFNHAEVPPELREEMERAGIMSEVALPLGAGPWGVLTLFSESARDYDEEEIGLLERLASEIDHATDFIAKSERLEYLAYHNPVTGLPSRSAFREQVQAMQACGPMIVCVLDIRRFAYINDSRGRAFGDQCLRHIGKRLRRAFPAPGFVAHPEGCTFLLAYPVTDTLSAEIERLQAQLRRFENQVFTIDGEEIFINPQGGVAIAPQHGNDGEMLERNGMSALAEADRRDELLHVFSEDLQGHAARRLKLEHDLRRALAQREFELFYQPKFNTVGNRLIGAEALLRWHSPTRGTVLPAEFIPVLEETGLIVPVGEYVMREALGQVMAWRTRHQPGLRIAVNVSARELRYNGFLDQCHAILEPSRADQGIDIEITESLLMDDIDRNIPLLEQLRGLGCHISIDDFGTGYSSLNYLTRLPADEIKIDQSFIATLAQSPETMGLITNIINLAHSLSLRVVAEGVENEEQVKLLRLLRCDVLQGYFLGKPMPATLFEELLVQLA